mmetsp:Transcript_89921/g.160009  ORF Transcript_89921/g.160009 Transcript_89921/m.160009 type:complete len:160 (+) Transcript_89921:847-1326(+)
MATGFDDCPSLTPTLRTPSISRKSKDLMCSNGDFSASRHFLTASLARALRSWRGRLAATGTRSSNSSSSGKLNSATGEPGSAVLAGEHGALASSKRNFMEGEEGAVLTCENGVKVCLPLMPPGWNADSSASPILQVALRHQRPTNTSNNQVICYHNSCV